MLGLVPSRTNQCRHNLAEKTQYIGGNENVEFKELWLLTPKPSRYGLDPN